MTDSFALKNGQVLENNALQTKEINNLIYLLSCAVNETKPDAKYVENMDLDDVYHLALFHSVVSLTAFALEELVTLPRKFDQAKKKAIRKNALFDNERSRVYAQLSKEKIWHMSLKGIILKDYYPKFGMREMSDNDILCDDSHMADVRRIMENLGFQCTVYDERVDDTYTKSPVAFEMHRFLFDERESESFYLYYKNIKEKLLQDDKDEYEFYFTPEDFYVYMVAHEYKHYISGGTGLRSLLDIYVYLNRWNGELDWQYITCELDKLGIKAYERKTRTLAKAVFSGVTLGEEDREELLYYVTSGTFGTIERRKTNQLAKNLSGDDSKQSKQQYIKNRLFLPMDVVKKEYPFFYHHKYLLPFLSVYRLFKATFIKPKEVWAEYRRVNRFKY